MVYQRRLHDARRCTGFRGISCNRTAMYGQSTRMMSCVLYVQVVKAICTVLGVVRVIVAVGRNSGIFNEVIIPTRQQIIIVVIVSHYRRLWAGWSTPSIV
jgi:hypothetical protein